MDNFAKLVALALLGLAPLANAQSVTATAPFTNFMRNVTGANSATVSFSGAGTPVLSKAPTALGGTAGWTMASNFGTKVTASGGIDLATSGAVNVGKHSVPVTLTGTASKAATLAGMRTAFMGIARAGAGPLGMLFLLPDFMNWVTDAGVERNPDHSNTEKPFLKTRSDVEKFCPPLNPQQQSAVNACSAKYNSYSPFIKVVIEGQQCHHDVWGTSYIPGSVPRGLERCLSVAKVPLQNTVNQPASWDEVAEKWVNAKFGAATLPKFIDETERIRKENPNAGIKPFAIDLQFEKATGPATLPALAPTITSTTKVNPDGSTTVTTTTKTNTPTVEYTDNTVKVTDKELTKTEEKTCTETATCTTTKPLPDQETQKPAEEETDLCKLHPDILACVKVTDPGELEPTPVPNAEKMMQITPDQGWGPSGGTCPAPKTATIMGVNLVMPFTLLCDFATAIRPLLIAFAWLSAALTFFGLGRKD